MKNALIIDYARTPIGKYGGSLSTVRADDLAAIPIRELIRRNRSLNAAEIEDVILGCANQAGEDNRNVARMALLLAGLPPSVAGETVNRLCASGLSAAIRAAHAIAFGEGELFIAGGVEHMTRAPYAMSKATSAFGRAPKLEDSTFGWRFVNPVIEAHWGIDSMGQTAENLADEFQISREDQDKYALWSQEKTKKAQASKRLAKEIVSVSAPQHKGPAFIVDKDEFPRPDSSIDALAALKAVFRHPDGSVTAGNASGINDGAAALLLASEEGANKHGLKPLARIVSSAVVGVEPRVMGIGPVNATKRALQRAQLGLDQIDVIELNEAFAVQNLACIRELGLDDRDPRINPNGGAISLGHPLGMSGARLLGTAALELVERDEQFALITMCVGVGQGMATIIERV